MKQICQSVRLLIKRHFEEARLFVAFYLEFEHFMQFLSIGLIEYFLAVHRLLLLDLNAMQLSVCKIKSKRCSLGRKTS